MKSDHLYETLRAGSASAQATAFRIVHHSMVTAGIAVMLAESVQAWRDNHGLLLAFCFHAISAFFIVEYLLRLIAAPRAPMAQQRGAWQARADWALSLGGIFDLLAAFPAVLNLVLDTEDAILFCMVWVFKFVRFAPGLANLQRAIGNARGALFSVLLGFVVVLLAASSLEYLFERGTQPEVFGSIPAALWWGIVTMTNTGYGDSVPMTLAGRMLAGIVMGCGIIALALLAGILATGFAQEMRRHAFLRTWNIVAKVPFFQTIGASTIAEVARLLRPREYPAGAVIVRRGEPGDCMYFIAAGEVSVELTPEALRLGTGDFFGEIALLTGARRTATVVASQACTLLRLDIVEFRELMGRQPDLARVIYDAAHQRLSAVGPGRMREQEAAWDFGISA